MHGGSRAITGNICTAFMGRCGSHVTCCFCILRHRCGHRGTAAALGGAADNQPYE